MNSRARSGRFGIAAPVCAAALLCRPLLLPGQQWRVVTDDTVASGVVYQHLQAPDVPWDAFVATINLKDPHLALRVARADTMVSGREATSAIARSHASGQAGVIVAINGDFFDLKTGANEGNQVIDGEVWQASRETSEKSALALVPEGKAAVALERFDAAVCVARRCDSLDGVNRRTLSDGAVLYTRRAGAITPNSSDTALREIRLAPAARAGDTLALRVISLPASAGTTLLASQDALSAPREWFAAHPMPAGTIVDIVLRITPFARIPDALIGGRPRLVTDGRDIADSSDRAEGTVPSFSKMRHPRTGVGVSGDSSTLILVVVDGRQRSSAGMTLQEFARFMLARGAWQAINFDGGGSSTMVIDGTVVNHPSDAAGERPVGNALLIEAKP